MIRTLSLFSGIGAFDLGLERTGGFQTVAFCECEPFCRAVLAHHWPGVPCYDDVRTLTAARLAADGIFPDAICGGFPCQDISVAGRGAGLDADRSGLWHEYARLVGEIRPRWVIIENVPALRSRGLDRVLGSLMSFGYVGEFHCIPAAALGAPHRRDRIWIVGHTDRPGREGIGMEHGSEWRAPVEAKRTGSEVDDPASGGCRKHGHERGTDGEPGTGQSSLSGQTMADANPSGLPLPEQPKRCEQIVTVADIERAASECHWRRAVAGLGRTAARASFGVDGCSGPEETEKINALADSHAGPSSVSTMRSSDRAQTIQWEIGGQDDLSAQDVLRHAVRPSGVHQGNGGSIDSSLASMEVSEADVRGVRRDQEAARPPLRQQSSEHGSVEPSNPMPVLPRLLALDGKEDRAPGAGANAGSMAGARYPVATEAWEGDTPRTVAGGTPGRVPRLRALGNALVPQIPEMIGNAILRYEEITR